MSTYSAAVTPGKYNVWIPPAHVGNIGVNNGLTLTNGAFVAFNTAQEAQANVQQQGLGVILDPNGAYDATQLWAGASQFQTQVPTSPVNLNPPAPTSPTTTTPGAPAISTTPSTPSTPSSPQPTVAGLTPVSDLTSPNSQGVGDIEAIAVEKLPDGSGGRIALRFRSMKPNEAPDFVRVSLTQTAFGEQPLQTFTGVLKPVSPTSTVSEGEITIKYGDHPTQGLAAGTPLGIYAHWPSGHDRAHNENPLYVFNMP